MNWTVIGQVFYGLDDEEQSMKNVMKEVSNENDRKTSEGEQVTASNSKLHS